MTARSPPVAWPVRLTPQHLLPALQLAALPLYWLIGRHLAGLGAVAAGVFTVISPFAVHTAVLGIGFVVSGLNQHAERGVRHSRWRDWLIAYAREAVVSIRQFYWLMPLRAGFRVPAPATPLRRPPIVLVHGYGCNRGLWLPAARWFARQGYQVSAIDLAPLHGSIDGYCGTIADEIRRVRAETGADRIALVAHSMGGLAVRAYLRWCAASRQDCAVAAVITLGTPHRGTHIARVGRGENARQMRFATGWVQELSRHEATDAVLAVDPARRPSMTTICSLQDNIVSRPLEQRLPGARAIVVRRQGHMSLATSPRVFKVVDKLLRRAAHMQAGVDRS
jgi:pimeloyl-ACP methyl ester carboxylesterase